MKALKEIIVFGFQAQGAAFPQGKGEASSMEGMVRAGTPNDLHRNILCPCGERPEEKEKYIDKDFHDFEILS